MPAGFHQPTSDLESIIGIQFGIFSPDEIVKRSVVEVISQATYDGNEPKIGGLFDPRMGVLDNGKTCRSCGQTNHGCPGHFGHYRLARPVYFIQFLPMIRNILRCVCIRCSKLLIDKNNHARITKRRGESRWKAVLDACSKVSRCGQETEDGCGTVRPKTFHIEGIARIVAEWSTIPTAEEGEAPLSKDTPNKIVKQPLEVEYVLRLFRQILDEDVDFMGLSRYWCRPDWMICTVLPIPPPQVRPSVVQDNNQRSEDDLTHKLFEIIKSNKKLQEQINKNSNRNMIDELTTLLQYHVATLVDNKIPGVAPSAQRGGRPLKSLQQRIGSKEGRVRYNIQGKRVEQSARSVITGDPNISIAEVGVPMKIAMNLTRPEMVTVYNRDRLYKYIQNGAEVFPGAKSIIRKDGRMISLKHVNTKELVLYNGDTVNRHLMDGDIILFNRQPTLHRMSMMGHRVRVLPYNTFRLNVTVTRPYNADFDGDEMNAHIPQSYEATVELQEIASVPMQIIRPRDAMPVIGVVQDALAGAYLATRPNNLFTRREFMNMMMKNKRFQDVPEPVSGGRYNGQQIIGTLFPPINISMENSRYDADSQDYNKVKIREGVFSQGVLDKGIFNKAGKGIVHTIYNDYGPKEAVDFMDGLQNMVEIYLIMKGFSVGISDLIADEETRKKMEQTINEKKKEVDDMILQVHMDLFTNNSGKSNQEEFESKAIGILNKATVDSGKFGVESLSDENRLMTMVRSGSKGDATNVAQMIACVGQQAPEGRRIPYGFTDRTLPHYKMFDDGAEARGFVEGSFLRGLTPQEFFFHAMSGREGLIDTAVKTADTGYTQRQLIKAMEDLMTQHDGTVRDASGKIVQFHYGEDGINSTKIEGISLPLGKFTEESLRAKFSLDGVDLSQILTPGTERGDDSEAIEEFVENVSMDRKMLIEGVFGGGRSTALFAPLNIERLLTNFKIKFNLDTSIQTSLTPLMVLNGIETIINKTQPYNKIWCAALRFHLAPHKIIIEERFTVEAWNAFVLAIVVKNMKALAPPGELVGIVAAQSIGEPATQMTLNSVDWDTEIIIAKNGKIVTPQIGEFIDNYYMNCPESSPIQHLDNGRIYIELNDGNDWKALSCDENGVMKWTKLEAITRHPVVNEDGSNTILEVELESGRSVKATKGESFLTMVGGKIIGTKGSDLKIGDELPIGNSLALDGLGHLKEISLREYLPPTDYLYGTEVYKALEVMHTDERHWFQKNQGTLFTVPYNRSDSFREAFDKGHNTNVILPGFVYNKHMKLDVSQVPETIELTEEFGYFVGAYLAEGMSNKTQVCITNNDELYLERVKKLMTSWNVGTHTVCEEREAKVSGIKGTTTSLIIHSTIIAKVMGAMFGRLSYDKILPDWVLQAPDCFVQGLMDAYICGDGSIDKKSGTVLTYSVSKKLLVRLGALLSRYEIYSKITSYMPELGKFKSVSRQYTLSIPTKYSNIFHSTFKLSMDRKQKNLDNIFGKRKDGNITCKWKTTKDVVWDKIKSIKEVTPMKDGWVYDVTVEETRNFMSLNMLGVKDTFHQAGVSSKSAMTRGVPRLKELLKVTKNPKANSLTISLKPAFRDDKDRVREVVQDLELTLLRDIVLKSGIYYDPDDNSTIIEEDQNVIAFFKSMELRNGPSGVEGNKPEGEALYSKWIIRLQFDREKMFAKNITMDDIYFVIHNAYSHYGERDNNIQTIYSDYNSQKLIMRIRPKLEDNIYSDHLSSIKKFQNTILNNTIIRGIHGIRAVTWRKDNSRVEEINGKYEEITQYILDTDGTNFVAIMNHPAVDGDRLYSTNVHDIYEQLGIEATRATLYSEINSLFGEADINYRHLGLLCDIMTHAGRLMSADRYGINKMDSGPLAKACFEETEKILLKAALFGEMDPITGVSANIMTGQPIRAGTGFTQILLDEAALPGLMKDLQPLPEDEEEVELPDQNVLNSERFSDDENDHCAQLQTQMNMTLPVAGTQLEDEEEIEIVAL
jgi:DNA-directed RNA polymerase beta' subunit